MPSEKSISLLLSSLKHTCLHGWCGRFAFILFLQLAALTSQAQYTKLYDFGSQAEGANPYSSLVSDGTFLYGTTINGGINSFGTIYKIKTDGTGFAKLFDFDGTNGYQPEGALYYDGTTLFGMTVRGGVNGNGNIFSIKPDGSGFTNLFSFDDQVSGAAPFGSLIPVGTFLYGMTTGGGTHEMGTIFKIKSDGTGYVKLFEFDYTNSGGNPYGSLYYDGTFLYGTTQLDGSNNYGTIFKINPDGTGYTKLLNFNGTGTGSIPICTLISDGTFLYGMTRGGGATNNGVIFKIMPDGTGYSKLLDFNYLGNGGFPKSSLVYDGVYLYGTTAQGGPTNGTVFKIKTDGTGFVQILHDGSSNGGPDPEGTLILIGGVLYGANSGLGIDFSRLGYLGTVYKINTDGSGYTRLLNFEATGTKPSGSLVLAGSFLYGTSAGGGAYNYGSIFKIMSDGTGYTKLLDFDMSTTGYGAVGRLIYDGTFLYGMTSGGGANGFGTIYKIKPDGTGFVKLLDFDNTNNGNEPNGSLIFDGTFLYGMTSHGGVNGVGTVFKIKTDGTGYVKLFDFNDPSTGSYPNGSLISDGTFLYGMTSSGGANSWGAIFKIKTDGTGFSKMFDFDYDNSGSSPNSSLALVGTFLYGMANGGGANTNGTIFKIKTDGTSFTKLLDFDGANTGGYPFGSLTSDGTFLYGMTGAGGLLGNGTVFRINPDGTGFTKLVDFNDGSYAQGSLISDGTFLYGMTPNGGANSQGVLFKCTMTPFVWVTDFVPPQGVVGTYVTLNGVDFDPTAANNIVKFNNITATVLSASPTAIVAIVPVGAATGPISVTANSTTLNTSDFNVTTQATMTNGTVQNCNVPFALSYSGEDGYSETFVPINPTDKVKVSFTTFDVGDILSVYDGPSASSPLLATLYGTVIPDDIVATGPGGELTFVFTWEDASSGWLATITCVPPGTPPVITTTQLTTQVGGKITLDLVPLITTTGSTLDLTSLRVTVPPPSGAVASIDAAGTLTIDYSGKTFSGTEQITIKACDTESRCASQDFSIDVAADIVVYNGVSPNGTNPSFRIENINVLPDTKENTVYIFDRWENQVWHGTNYDNSSVVFTGVSDGGSDLPSGVYYYKVNFASGRKKLTGFISLRRR